MTESYPGKSEKKSQMLPVIHPVMRDDDGGKFLFHYIPSRIITRLFHCHWFKCGISTVWFGSVCSLLYGDFSV
jgi:hypothetical protein